MIFVGDISLPYKEAIRSVNLPDYFEGHNWFGNLEGSVVNNLGDLHLKPIVFNDKEAIRALVKAFSFSGFALANNHILDTGTLNETISFLEGIKMPFCGVGNNLTEACKPIILEDNNKKVIILNFGWDVIQCEIGENNKCEVNPLTKENVLNNLRINRERHPDAKIIVFAHWSYELEGEPQPWEREFARFLIDHGADGIIGCHPHRIGGFELYNSKPILYSLGNWMFKQDYYHKMKLRFPEFCDMELAFEWNFETDTFRFHFFIYNKKDSRIDFLYSEDVDSPTMLKYTPFRNMDNKTYRRWYKKNHYHKGKGLPIYYWEDSDAYRGIKNKINKIRDLIIFYIVKFR